MIPSKTPEYAAWSRMKGRCLNSHDSDYPRYGGRGIVMCDRWLQSFSNFQDDMPPHPGKGYSIDRIDNDGGYEPSNCHWATASEQTNNRSNTIQITIDGVTKPLASWMHLATVDRALVCRRLKNGWSDEEAVTAAAYSRRRATIPGRPWV